MIDFSLSLGSAFLLNLFEFFCESVDCGDACEAASQSVFCAFAYRVDSQLFAWLVPVRDWKRHRRFCDKVYRVAYVSRDPGGCLAALFHLYACDADTSHAFFDQIRLQRSACETVSCVLDHHRLVGPRLEKVHQLEGWAVSSKALVLVSM